jgi:hypothetical protein
VRMKAAGTLWVLQAHEETPHPHARQHFTPQAARPETDPRHRVRVHRLRHQGGCRADDPRALCVVVRNVAAKVLGRVGLRGLPLSPRIAPPHSVVLLFSSAPEWFRR